MTDINKLATEPLEAEYPCVSQLVDTVRAEVAELLPPEGLLRAAVFTPRARRCALHIELLELCLVLHSADMAAEGQAVLYTLHHTQLGELGMYTSLGALFSGLIYRLGTTLSTTDHLVVRRGVVDDAGEIVFTYLLRSK